MANLLPQTFHDLDSWLISVEAVYSNWRDGVINDKQFVERMSGIFAEIVTAKNLLRDTLIREAKMVLDLAGEGMAT